MSAPVRFLVSRKYPPEVHRRIVESHAQATIPSAISTDGIARQGDDEVVRAPLRRRMWAAEKDDRWGRMFRWYALGLLTVFGLPSVSAYAAQLTVDSSGLEKLVKDRLFTDEGRYRLAKPDKCNYPYLETPSIEIRQGRLYVRARFAGRVGRELAGRCLSAGEPSWITVSGKPVVAGGALSLDDVKVEYVEKQIVRAIAEGLIKRALGTSMKVNVREVIQPYLLPANTAPYALELNALSLKLIEADGGRLRLAFDFSLAIR